MGNMIWRPSCCPDENHQLYELGPLVPQPMISLEVPIGPKTLENAMDDYFRSPKPVVDECDRCGKEVTIELEPKVMDAADGLLVQLQRFTLDPDDLDGQRKIKNNKPVKLGGNLRLAHLRGDMVTYEITAAIQHLGSVDSG